MGSEENKRKQTWLIALSLAFVVHLALLGVLQWATDWPQKTSPKPRTVIRWRPVKVTESADRPKPEPIPFPSRRPQGSHIEPGRPTAAAKPTEIETSQKPQNSSPIELFPRAALEKIAAAPRGDTSVAQLKSATKKAQRQHAAKTSAPKHVLAWGEQFEAWFTVDDNIVKRAGMKQFGPVLGLKRSLKLATQDDIDRYQSKLDSQEVWRDPSSQTRFAFCWGDCAGKGHTVIRKALTLSIDHDDQGRPLEGRIETKSTDPNLDDAALTALSMAKEYFSGHPGVVGDPIAKRSLWRFEIRARRFGRADLWLNPSLKPPGKKITKGPLQDLFGKTMLERSVTLLEIEFWPVKGSGKTSGGDILPQAHR